MSTDRKPDLRVSRSAQELAAACSQFILDTLTQRIREGGTATLAISGGETPRVMFADLAKAPADWSKIHVFWVDERCVPPDSELSNFRLANETLLGPTGIPKQNIHRIFGELDPEKAAQKYIAEIRNFFSLADGALPAFDIIHRGMGNDAHTASLFPGEPLIGDRTNIAAHVWVEKLKMHRITLLPGVLLNAGRTVMEVVGPDKADPLYNVLCGTDDPFQYPCQIATRGSNKAVWFLDEPAATKVHNC
jgi:6-phosphogluconolactonase